MTSNIASPLSMSSTTKLIPVRMLVSYSAVRVSLFIFHV